MNEVVAEVVPGARTHCAFGTELCRRCGEGPADGRDACRADPGGGRRMGRGADAAVFRIYGSDDVLGVEIGGALKNVLAIACGISDGRGLGDSARAALTTRGFAELMRFGRKLGARPETLTGLSGLGDLLLTCSSPQSRNYSFGLAIGQGASVSAALAHRAAWSRAPTRRGLRRPLPAAWRRHADRRGRLASLITARNRPRKSPVFWRGRWATKSDREKTCCLP